jgi:hypothetical protein
MIDDVDPGREIQINPIHVIMVYAPWKRSQHTILELVNNKKIAVQEEYAVVWRLLNGANPLVDMSRGISAIRE